MENQILDILFFSLAAIGWSVVYLEAIRIGNKQKTYCIPFLALALNFTWEIIAPVWYRVLTVYSAAYIVWAILDMFILSTYIKYGYADFKAMTGGSKKGFNLWTILVLCTAFLWQLVCQYTLNDWLIVSSFKMNLLMSILFIYMLWVRKSSKGQSLVIAFAKCIGSVGVSLQGIFTMHNIQMWGWGLLMLIFDVLYIVLLHKTIQKEKNSINYKNRKKVK